MLASTAAIALTLKTITDPTWFF